MNVVMLELVLGKPNVFQINALTRSLLDQHFVGWNEGLKELPFKEEIAEISEDWWPGIGDYYHHSLKFIIHIIKSSSVAQLFFKIFSHIILQGFKYLGFTISAPSVILGPRMRNGRIVFEHIM
ncbi:hypothetical protein L6164_034503 [Bauhinia variegata]|uniref:Uncharacterized protein n=1 Tax=Bauhinia variegata TaxID=167791 RepID=A0ACB9KV43_BAUVA|nr:hypothetical protein L6164_034503 [Bauhinia variegata]